MSTEPNKFPPIAAHTPTSPVPEASGDAADDALSFPDPWQLNVLVVEDNPSDLHWTVQTLEGMEDYEIRYLHAASVEAAVDLIGRHKFDVALIDYQLPDGHGDEVVSAIAARSSACAPVLLSGHTMSEVSHFALRSGAVAAMSKDDLNPGLLETTIRFALRNHAMTRLAADKR